MTILALAPLPMPALAQQSVPPAEASPAAEASQVAQAEHSRDVEPNQQDAVEGIAVEKARPGFLDGGVLSLKPRTYYLNRDRDKSADNVGWALGGAVDFRSGWAADRFQLAATLYTSQILYGRKDEDGTQLFKPGPEPFTVLGEANMTARLSDSDVFRIGRQSFDLPWLARQDVRMAPNTFEAVAIGRQADNGFAYISGYVDSIKRKNDDKFISMSEAAGAPGSHKGLGVVGGQYTFKDGSLIGAIDERSFDVMNTLFVKAEKSFEMGSETSFRLSGQYTDQRSIGDDLIGAFSTHLAAVKGEVFWKNASFRLAASRAGEERGLQSPFGGTPNYLSIIVDNFDRAGEHAVMIGASYDFKGVGLDGLSMFSNISTGHTPNSGPTASPDETEYDLTVDYRFKKGAAKGLWIRVRGAWIDQNEAEAGANDLFDFRVIVNYAFDLP